jgi:CHAD domain-containing protein
MRTAPDERGQSDALLLQDDAEVARALVLRTIKAARAAEGRLDDPRDAEALHDFRVAIRRLRSLLRAWSAQLEGAVHAKDRRALREIQRATGAGREAEVTLLWLAEQKEDLPPSQAAGLNWLTVLFEARRRKCSEELNADVRASFLKCVRGLQKRLKAPKNEGGPAEQTRLFAHSLAERIEALAQELQQILCTAANSHDAATLHSARIVGKRLRYLLEPLRRHLPQALGVVKQSKEIQDVLGNLNDVHVLMEEIEAAIVPVMAKRAKRVRRALRDRDISRARAETSTNESLGFVELYDRLLARQTQLLDELDKARERGDLDRWVAMTLQLAGDLRAMSTADQ